MSVTFLIQWGWGAICVMKGNKTTYVGNLPYFLPVGYPCLLFEKRICSSVPVLYECMLTIEFYVFPLWGLARAKGVGCLQFEIPTLRGDNGQLSPLIGSFHHECSNGGCRHGASINTVN